MACRPRHGWTGQGRTGSLAAATTAATGLTHPLATGLDLVGIGLAVAVGVERRERLFRKARGVPLFLGEDAVVVGVGGLQPVAATAPADDSMFRDVFAKGAPAPRPLPPQQRRRSAAPPCGPTLWTPTSAPTAATATSPTKNTNRG